MSNQPSALRFEHREVAVIFSLFIFVSLLMFTVGIVVGKGITQAKPEGFAATLTQNAPVPAPPPADRFERHGGSSVNYPTQNPAALANRAPAEAPAAEAKEPTAPEPLKLIPKVKVAATPAEVAAHKEAEALTKNPKIRALLEGYGAPAGKVAAKAPTPEVKKEIAPEEPRATASVPPPVAAPPSFANGPFTVQVGSYPTKADAVDRINQLTTLGFPHAYLSVKKFGDGKEIWYRVWLGYYPDMGTAKKSGEFLQQRGEVNNYLIRKSDNPG